MTQLINKIVFLRITEDFSVGLPAGKMESSENKSGTTGVGLTTRLTIMMIVRDCKSTCLIDSALEKKFKQLMSSDSSTNVDSTVEFDWVVLSSEESVANNGTKRGAFG